MIQTIDISLIPSDNKPVINVSQFDNISRVLRFNVFDDVDMEVPHVFDDGDTVLLNIRKNDNNIVVITGVIVSDIDPETQEITGQYLTFELTEQACACVGSNYGEVSITSGSDEVIGSCNFKLIVERSPLAGGVSSQTAIDNLTTQIEEITEEVIGDNYYDKEDIDGKFDELDIPTKTSQLTNDSGFITARDIPTIPTKTSQLTNDSGFITAADIPTIPTKTSQLTNDSGFITEADIPTIPTKTSQLTNDSGFTTIDDVATADDKTWSSDKISDEIINILPTGTANGSIANFNTSLALPLVSAKFDVNATQEAGTPTPQSPKAISGVSAVNVTACGKNLIDTSTLALRDVTGNNVLRTSYAPIKCNAGKYTLSFSGSYVMYITNITAGYTQTEVSTSPRTITLASDTLLLIRYSSNILSEVNTNIQFEESASASDYSSYNGSTTLINLGGTYYGGYVEQDKDGHRKLVVTKQLYVFSGNGTWTWVDNGAYWRLTFSLSFSAKSPSSCLCEVALCSIVNVRYLIVRVIDNPTITSESDMNSIFSSGVKLVYELAEPIEIDLPDGEPITAFNGVNNVYADSGDCEVTYKCSINEAINAAIASQSNRTLSLMRLSKTFETIEPIERGDNNDENER